MKTIIHFIDEIRMGGAQTHLLTILKEMIVQYPQDKHVVAVLFDGGGLEDEFRSLPIEVQLLELREHFAEKEFSKAYKVVFHFIKKYQPDVVETHLTWSRLLANTAAYFNKVPVRIGFEQGDIYMDSYKFRAANFLTQKLFHKIIVCSSALKKWANKTHGIKASKMKVMYNCVNLQKFTPVSDKNLESFLKADKRMPLYNFVTVATLGNGVNKRVDISIRVIAELRKKKYDVGLVICGDGEQRSDLEKLAEALNVHEQIFFLGLRNDVDQVLPHCFAFVHAAPFEPFGIVCIEAMACGLPAVVPDSGGIKDIVKDGEDGYVYKSLSVKAMVEKLSLLIKNKEKYMEMTHTVLQNVKKYGVNSYVKELYQLYNEQ